ncbi:hypothetical protein ACFQ1I_34460 [Kitasatospora arboriphila]
MTQKVRFITIVALGLGVLTGVATTAQTGGTAYRADGDTTPALTSTGTPLPRCPPATRTPGAGAEPNPGTARDRPAPAPAPRPGLAPPADRDDDAHEVAG